MAILGFEENIMKRVSLVWHAKRADIYVRRLFIPPNPNYESVKLVSLVFGAVKLATMAPLEFFSVERGLDGCGPGQPLVDEGAGTHGIYMSVGNEIRMYLDVDPIFGAITLRGMFEASHGAEAFIFRRSST